MLHRSMTHELNLEHLSDHALLAETTRAAAGERRATGQLVALLSEVDANTLSRRGLLLSFHLLHTGPAPV